jgi:hypothetical protein
MDHLPKDFLESSKSTQTKIVSLGIYTWSLVQNEVQNHKELSSADLIKVWKESGKKEAYAESERVVREKEFELNRLQRQLDSVQKSAEADFEAKKALLVREARLAAMEEVAKIKEENMRLKLNSDFKTAYDFLFAKFEEETKKNADLLAQIQDLKRVKTSFHLGKEGENEIENYLKQISDFDYHNTCTEADKGDFRLTSKDNHVILLDSKKFTHAVPKRDREKLVDNTDKDANVVAGVMVSLNSKISARQHCEIEFSPKNKPVLYLCLSGMTEDAKVHVLDTSVKFLMRLVSADSSKGRSDILQKFTDLSVALNTLAKNNENVRKAASDILDNTKLSAGEIKNALKLVC